MNIKKMTAAIFTLIALVLIIGAGTVLFITSRDSITLTDIREYDHGAHIIHNTESGRPLGLSLSHSVFTLGDGHDGLYRINITLNQEDSKFYGLENLSAVVSFGNNGRVISSYCSSGDGVYSESRIDYRYGNQVVCDFDGNYAYIDIIAQLSQTDGIPVKFTYDVSGKGLNSLNGFPDQSFEITVPCNDKEIPLS